MGPRLGPSRPDNKWVLPSSRSVNAPLRDWQVSGARGLTCRSKALGYALCMNTDNPRPPFLAIPGDQDRIEQELVPLLRTPGPTPHQDLPRLMTIRESSSRRVAFITVGPKAHHPASE